MNEKAKAFVRPVSLKAFGRALRQARVAAGKTLESLAEETGISKPYLAHIETARTPGPPTEGKLKLLARALGIEGRVLVEAGDWLHTPGSVRKVLRRAGGGMLSGHSGAAPGGGSLSAPLSMAHDGVPRRGDGAIDLDVLMRTKREGANGMKTQEVEMGGEKNDEDKDEDKDYDDKMSICSDMIGLKAVPLINRVAAGKAGEFGDLSYPAGVADAYVAAPDLPEAAVGAMFAVKVVGDSMLPEYREGDVIIVGPGEAKDGDDCVVRLGEGENFATTFKRVFFEREGEEVVGMRLVPLNVAFEERRVRLEEVSGVYPMVYRLVPRRAGAGAKVRASEKLKG